MRVDEQVNEYVYILVANLAGKLGTQVFDDVLACVDQERQWFRVRHRVLRLPAMAWA